jgi:hypothetical protein
MNKLKLFVVLAVLAPSRVEAFFGTELGPLLQLVAGQLTEIERLTETLGAARDQARMLRELNQGVDRAVTQIRNMQTIMERTQGLDPSSVRSLSDLNDLLARANQTKQALEGLMQAKVALADQAIASSALQSDTTYRMGQEMTVAGSQLAVESQSASPGRSSQITAAANSAQMLATGVELQTLAQIVQLQAMTLEFQKSQVEQDLYNSRLRRAAYERQLTQVHKGGVR